MIVISDTSPVLNLAVVGQLELLREWYVEVFIPPKVAYELDRNGFALHSSVWIRVKAPRNLEAVQLLRQELDPGESEAIVPAQEEFAELLLIDERRGWRIATEKGIPRTGLLGVLAEAKKRGLIDLCRPILDEMTRRAGFWIGKDLRSKYLSSLGEGE